tara:strand:+ start:7196 stop:8815 length:1620 start_codon:yes stop_codon:yes gene_type:complete
MAEKTFNLFGFDLITPENEKKQVSPIPVEMDDGTELPVGGRIGYTYELDKKYRNEHQLISQYRSVSFYPEADAAIDDIVNEAFVVEHERAPVSIRLDTLNIDDRIKKIMRKEFKNVLHFLKFQKKSYDMFRQWYVDGRLYYQVIIDKKNPKEGIVELRPIDSLKIKRVVKPEYQKDKVSGVPVLTKVNEWFEYAPDKNMNSSAKLSKDSVVFCPSGLVDRNRGMIVGYLDKAIKPFNNLRSMEDALIVYRIARAPERRIFYVDVGQLPKIKAEQYIKDMMNRYRNKIDYDPATGSIRDSRKFMSMLEDFWLPRRDGSKGTEITTLPGGQNLGDLDDVEYFKGKLYQALNVPMSRMNQDNNFQLGRASDISRDELKFTKFIHRIRKQFAEIFNEVLRVQLVLKGVCTTGEFEEMRQYITYDYISDTHFENLKRIEILGDQLNVLRDASEYVGKYFSIEYIRKEILGQTEEDIARIDKQIMDEMDKEQIVDVDVPADIANNDFVSMYDDYKKSPQFTLTENSSDLDINTSVVEEDSDAVTE